MATKSRAGGTSARSVFNRMLVDLASGEQITLDDREITITDGQADIDRGDHSVEVTFQRLYNLTMEDLR